MTKKQTIQLFEEWDEEQEKWYFSIVDVCGVLLGNFAYVGLILKS